MEDSEQPDRVRVSRDGSWLHEVRKQVDLQERRARAALVQKRLDSLAQRQNQILQELGDEKAPTQVGLSRDRMKGIAYFLVALATVIGVVFLLDYSLRVFLPQSQFPIWWQLTAAVILAVGTVFAFHFWLKNPRDDEPSVPGWLTGTGVCAFVLGLFALALVRGLHFGSAAQSSNSASPTTPVWWMDFFGVVGFVVAGLGLDIIGGIAGALSWAKLTQSVPLLRLYRRLRRVDGDIGGLEEELASLLPEVATQIRETATRATEPATRIAEKETRVGGGGQGSPGQTETKT